MTLAAISFGVIGLTLSGGFVEDIFIRLADFTIRAQSGHLQIAKSGFFDQGSRSPDKYLIENPEVVKSSLGSIKELDDVMARLDFSGLLNNGRSDLAIIGQGVEPEKEARLGAHVHIIAGRQLSSRDQYGILLGQGVASALNLKPDDSITLLASTGEGAVNTLSLDVVGVFQSFSKEFDARAVRVPLAAAQELVGSGGVNKLVLSLRNTEHTRAVRAAIEPKLTRVGLEVRSWDELNDFYRKAVDLYDRQFGVLQLIILAMVFLSVANSVNMSVQERLGEFGTLMATGNRRGEIFQLIVSECALLGIFGAVLGAVLGVALAWTISRAGIPMPPLPNSEMGYAAQIQLTPALVARALAIGFVATTAAGLLPALRISRTPVVDALRANV